MLAIYVIDKTIEVYKSLDFINAYHHFPAVKNLSKEEEVTNELAAATMATFLVKVLKVKHISKTNTAYLHHTLTIAFQDCTNFFNGSCCKHQEVMSEDEEYVANLLVHFIKCLPANTHDIGALNLARSVINYLICSALNKP